MFTGFGYSLAPTADFNSDWAINFLDIESLLQYILEIQ